MNYVKTYLFLEDKNEVLNIYQRHWDRSTENADPYQKYINAIVQLNRGDKNALPFTLWNTAQNVTGFK